jgi:hypothetical protein
MKSKATSPHLKLPLDLAKNYTKIQHSHFSFFFKKYDLDTFQKRKAQNAPKVPHTKHRIVSTALSHKSNSLQTNKAQHHNYHQWFFFAPREGPSGRM